MSVHTKKSKNSLFYFIVIVSFDLLFWWVEPTYAVGTNQFMRSDTNFDGEVDLSDPVVTLLYLFQGGAPPNCEDAADVDDSGKLDISDAIYTLLYLFRGGPQPSNPFPLVGDDLTSDPLSCSPPDDCNPDNPFIYPHNKNPYCDCDETSYYAQGRIEICGNNMDENCDGIVIPCEPSFNPQLIGTMPDSPISLTETSGIVASRQYPGVYWVHRDSGDTARIYAIRDNGSLIRTFSVTKAAATDWEDISISFDENDKTWYLWIADIGNNPNQNPPMPRDELTIYKVPEPNPFTGETKTLPAILYNFNYPDGKHDAEALFIWEGIPYIAEKRTDVSGHGRARIYKFPRLDESTTVTLELIAEFLNDGKVVTGADISQDGRRLTLISDTISPTGEHPNVADRHWIIERAEGSTKIEDFISNPLQIWIFDFKNQQGEGICFIPETYDIFITSEERSIWSLPQSLYNP